MDVVLPLDRMTTAEKLRAMEALWADLTRNADDFESPAWHADVPDAGNAAPGARRQRISGGFGGL